VLCCCAVVLLCRVFSLFVIVRSALAAPFPPASFRAIGAAATATALPKVSSVTERACFVI
jgi:hypothetical protein